MAGSTILCNEVQVPEDSFCIVSDSQRTRITTVLHSFTLSELKTAKCVPPRAPKHNTASLLPVARFKVLGAL
eukprot:5347800-Amphidinium_carterae.1